MWDAAAGRKIRVAFVVGEYPPEERKRREDAALAYSSAEVEVGIVSVKATPYFIGNAPDLLGVAVPPFLDAFREAERQGYDAVVPLGTLDLGVDAGRCVVDIPVVGPSESMLHIASMLGRRFGIIMYDDFVIPLGYRMVERFHMIDKVVGWRTCGFELPDIIANRDKVVSTVRRQCARAGQARRRRDPADGHHPVPGAHQARLADAGARRAGGRRHRRADPARRHAGEPQAQLQPRVLAEVRIGEGEVRP